jgi:ribosomal protein L24E
MIEKKLGTEHLRIMVCKDSSVRVMLVCVNGEHVERANWGKLPRKAKWTWRQKEIMKDIDSVRCVQWKDGKWRSLLGETR